MGVSGPSLLIESTDSMIILCLMIASFIVTFVVKLSIANESKILNYYTLFINLAGMYGQFMRTHAAA